MSGNTKTEKVKAMPSPELAVTLSRPFEFEGAKVTVVDLSELSDLKCSDLRIIKKIYQEIEETPLAAPEYTTEFSLATVSYLTKIPVKFLDNNLSIPDAIALRAKITNFFSESL